MYQLIDLMPGSVFVSPIKFLPLCIALPFMIRLLRIAYHEGDIRADIRTMWIISPYGREGGLLGLLRWEIQHIILCVRMVKDIHCEK